MIDIEGPKSRDFELLQEHFDLTELKKAFWEGYHYMVLGLQRFDRAYYQAWESTDETTSKHKIIGSRYLELPAHPVAAEIHGPTRNVLVFKNRQLAMDMIKDEIAGPFTNRRAGIMRLVYAPEKSDLRQRVRGTETIS